MEVDHIQCKFPRFRNDNERIGSPEIGQNRKMDEHEEDGDHEQIVADDNKRCGGGVGRFYGLPSSRIVRVTRASGGKDRHSKVLTSKGLRDRRVRLSVNTAIQFYDLQDRLGYDQPSKAVEWLLKAAESSIAELPPMYTPFPDTPMNDEKRSGTAGSDQVVLDTTVNADMDACGGDPSYLPKSSACNSNSETSKGSGPSLSRSESRNKARENVEERLAEKEEKNLTESCKVPFLHPSSQIISFTELLNGGFGNVPNSNGSVHETPDRDVNDSTFFEKSPRQWSSASIDYLTNGLLGGQMQFTNSLKRNPGYYHSELQSFDFGQDQLLSVGGNNVINNGDNQDTYSSGYNLNFAISSSGSSGLAHFNRGTLQSNSSSSLSLLPPVHRFPPTDGSPTGFLIGAVENHQQFPSVFDARLQLFYDADTHGNNGKNAEQKGKGKN